MELNGGSVVAMVGKDCVAIASDLRLGNQAVGIAANFDKVRKTVRAEFSAGETTTDFEHR
jgi:20S proteasome alpha/beta subunit